MSIKKVVLTGYTPAPSRLHLGTYDSYGIEQLEVVPGPEWAGLTITATFVTPAGSTRIVVPEIGIFDVPQEATAHALSIANLGKIVFAGVTNGVQRISTDVFFTVAAHSPVEGSDPAPTPSEWEQYVEQLKGVVDAAVPTTDTAGLVLHSGGTDAPNYWAAGGGGTGGVTPVISAVAETLPAGSAATVERSGPDDAPLFTFGIPRGDTGATGPEGPQGPAYTLTEADKQTIVQAVLAALPVYNGEVE